MTFVDNDKPVIIVLIVMSTLALISTVKLTGLAPWILYYQCKDVKENQEDAVRQQIEEVSILAKLSPLVM